MSHTAPRTAAPPRQRRRRRVPGYLLLSLALLLIVLACLCIWLTGQRRTGIEREAALSAALEQLRSEETQQQEELERLRDSLADRQTALDEARETINQWEAQSLPAASGILPEYTRLYPEMYAQPWKGDTVTGGKVVCLTFDDGPSANTDRILATLEQYGVKATFFVVGQTGEADQQRMRDIVAAGHTLAVHSWSHDYKKIYASVEAYLEDFNRLYEWIHEVTGVYPQIFRFPGGSINSYDRGVYQEIIAEMTRRGFVYFDWNVSAQDATVKQQAASVITESCLQGIGKDLAVVLAHDSAPRSTTADALPAVIEGYRAAGYTFAPLTPGVTPVIMGYAVEK